MGTIRNFTYAFRIDKGLRYQFENKVNAARSAISLKKLKPIRLTAKDALRAFIINSLDWDSEQLGSFIVEGVRKEAERVKELRSQAKDHAEMLYDLQIGYEKGWIDRNLSDPKYENYDYRILVADLFRRVFEGKTTIEEMGEELSLMPEPETEE